MIQDIWFYVFSIIIVILLSAAVPAIIKSFIRLFLIPLLTLIVMSMVAFIMPNFNDALNWQPLIGYAVFLTILSFVITIAMVGILKNNQRRNKFHHN